MKQTCFMHKKQYMFNILAAPKLNEKKKQVAHAQLTMVEQCNIYCHARGLVMRAITMYCCCTVPYYKPT